jgi:hypothetical protein
MRLEETGLSSFSQRALLLPFFQIDINLVDSYSLKD